MTEPSQYFKGRTVQEQMDEVIGYVDTRAEEVAAAKADAVLQPAENAKTAAQAAAQEAEAAKNATIAALPAIQQDISDLKAENVALDGRLNTVELKVQTAEGNIVTIQGQIVALQTADGQNVKINDINQYAVGLTGNQDHIAGTKAFDNSLIQNNNACPTMKPGNDEKNVTPSSDLTHNMVLIQDDSDNNLAGLFSTTETDGKRHVTAYVFDCNGTYRSQVIL